MAQKGKVTTLRVLVAKAHLFAFMATSSSLSIIQINVALGLYLLGPDSRNMQRGEAIMTWNGEKNGNFEGLKSMPSSVACQLLI